MKGIINGRVVLITGGTGSFGRKFTEFVLANYKPKKFIIFSRDELKQYEMQKRFNNPNISYFLGDIRDKGRIYRALNGVDIVVHAAALKQVPALEYNPFEAVQTNIVGAENLINAAIDNEVKRIIAISTDKAVNPINLYGATKLCAEKLFIAGNSYSGRAKTRFSVVRYGNVFNSRGSVAPFFKQERLKGVLPITDKRMTRFWITLEQGVKFVIKCLELMQGGEVFVPKPPSIKIIDLAKAIGPECRLKEIGIRPGEKLHEILISEDESRTTIDYKDMYIILPPFRFWSKKSNFRGSKLPEGFKYASNTNKEWLTIQDLRKIIKDESD